MLEDGSVRRDVGCVLTAWNPTFCSSDQTTETYAIQCCGDRDLCNENLTLTFLSPAVSSTQAPQPPPSSLSDTLGTTLSPMVPSLPTTHQAPPLLLPTRTIQDGSDRPAVHTTPPSPKSQPAPHGMSGLSSISVTYNQYIDTYPQKEIDRTGAPFNIVASPGSHMKCSAPGIFLVPAILLTPAQYISCTPRNVV